MTIHGEVPPAATADGIRRRIKENIVGATWLHAPERIDDEAAHANEDSLHQDVLRAIADGAANPEALAAAALETLNIEFARWYA